MIRRRSYDTVIVNSLAEQYFLHDDMFLHAYIQGFIANSTVKHRSFCGTSLVRTRECSAYVRPAHWTRGCRHDMYLHPSGQAFIFHHHIKFLPSSSGTNMTYRVPRHPSLFKVNNQRHQSPRGHLHHHPCGLRSLPATSAVPLPQNPASRSA